jgi:hypothetical protein
MLVGFYPMRTIKVTTKTSAQIAAAFADVFKDVKSDAQPKPATQKDRLAPYAKQIMKLRRRGLSWKQIAAGMADPRIGEKVNERILRKVLGEAPKADAATSSAPKPPVQRAAIDPLTGQTVTSVAPPR